MVLFSLVLDHISLRHRARIVKEMLVGGGMAQSIKCKLEGLSLDPQYLHKSQA